MLTLFLKNLFIGIIPYVLAKFSIPPHAYSYIGGGVSAVSKWDVSPHSKKLNRGKNMIVVQNPGRLDARLQKDFCGVWWR